MIEGKKGILILALKFILSCIYKPLCSGPCVEMSYLMELSQKPTHPNILSGHPIIGILSQVELNMGG